ncbi:MAG: hypothetical protein J6Q44_02860 [Alphaproteobacteria bacterium]|nr:hypothetical protein [Alphaproteobacteria bacterium]
MDEYGITIIDPNYRDIAAQQAYEREEQERTAEKLVIAAAREERWLNEPFLYEKIIARAKQIYAKLFSKQKSH